MDTRLGHDTESYSIIIYFIQVNRFRNKRNNLNINIFFSTRYAYYIITKLSKF